MSAAVAITASWRDLAACKESPENFFSDNDLAMARAKRVCAHCPVKAECLEAGRAEEHGVWGGMTPMERGIQPATSTDVCLSCGSPLIAISETRDKCLGCDSVWYR